MLQVSSADNGAMCTFYLAFVAITLWSFSTKADVRFVNPAAGATISAGTLNVQWGESGTAPLLSDLASFQLYLMTGGNDADDMVSHNLKIRFVHDDMLDRLCCKSCHPINPMYQEWQRLTCPTHVARNS